MPERPISPLAESLLSAFLNRAEEHALILLDPEGRVVGWLAAAERVLGYTAEEIAGESISRLFTPEDRALKLDEHELRTAAEHGKAEDDRWQVRKDGGRIWASGVTTAHRDAAGKLIGFYKVLRDRTDEKARIEAIESRLAAAAESDDRKGVFLATLAHELRNTLYSLGLSVDLIRMTLAEAEGSADLIGLLERQAAVTKRLVEDISDVTRVGTGKLAIEKRAVVLNDLLAEVVEGWRAKAASRGQELLLLLPEAPIVIDGDPERLHQVFVNLVSNALKYTPDGGKVAVKMTAEGADEAVTKIEDTGVGIAPEMQSRIFDLFTQETSSQEMAQGGYGVGLWLVKSLVDLHGGVVAVKSDGKGKGSEFTVRLPMRSDATSGEGGEVPA